MYAIEIQIKPENDTWFSIVFQFQHIDRFVWVLFLFFFKQKILLEQRNYSTLKSKDTFGILSSKYKTIPPFLSFSKYWFLLKNIYCTVFIGEVYLILEKKNSILDIYFQWYKLIQKLVIFSSRKHCKALQNNCMRTSLFKMESFASMASLKIIQKIHFLKLLGI